MKKKILSAMMAGVCALSLAACGSSSPGAGAASTTAASAAASSGETVAGAELKSEWKPSSAISVVLPAGAGGDTDLTARVFAQYAKELTGVDFVVVNASGAAGSVAANQVLSADANGLTVLFGHNLVNVANVAGVTDYNYTAFKLGPTFAKNPAQQFYVNPEKYKSLDEFIEAAKANPGQLKACTEVGAYTYYELLQFEKLAGIDLDLVDVGSNSDKITAMLSKQVDLMPGAYLNAKDYVASGQFLCLGAPTEERYDLIADIPTMKEQGIDMVFPDLDYSFYFPKETPDEVIAWFDELTDQLLQEDAVKEALANLTVMPYYLSSADSEKNDATYFDIFSEIAKSVEQ